MRDREHVSPRPVFSSLTSSPRLNLSHQNNSFSPYLALFLRADIALPEEWMEICPPCDQNADVAYHMIWFISATSLLSRYLFFSIDSSVHFSRERPSSWPSVPAEKDLLLDASRRLPLTNRKIFFSNMPISSATLLVFIVLKFPAMYWLSLEKEHDTCLFFAYLEMVH